MEMITKGLQHKDATIFQHTTYFNNEQGRYCDILIVPPSNRKEIMTEI